MRLLAVVLFAAAMSGCATPYQPNSLIGGFDETRVAENVFRVSFRGNGYTSLERAEDMALLRSADVALKHGYNFFVLTSGRGRIDSSSFTTPVTATTTGTATPVGTNAMRFDATTRTQGGQRIDVDNPTYTNVVVCFHEKPNTADLVYDARFVFDSLAKKYAIEGSK